MKKKRCLNCDRLLFYISEEPRERIEIKCPRAQCGRINIFERGSAKLEDQAAKPLTFSDCRPKFDFSLKGWD